MKYDLARIEPQVPSTATERIAAMRARGVNFSEYEDLPDGSVLGTVKSRDGWYYDLRVTPDGQVRHLLAVEAENGLE